MTEAAAWRVATRTVLFIFGLLFLVWLAVRLQAVIVQVLLAVILAAGMTPLVNRVHRPLPLVIRGRTWVPPRALVVLVLYLLLFLAIGLIGAVVIPPAVAQVEELVKNLPTYAADFQGWLATLPQQYPALPPIDFSQTLGDQLQSGASQVASVLSQAVVVARVALGVLGGALNGIFILVLALYITTDSDRIRRYFIGFLPLDRQEQAEEVTSRIGDRLGGWLQGQIMLSAIIGAMTLVGLLLIGVRYATLLALVAAIGEAIPLIGPIISAVPAVIIAFFQSPLQGFLTLGLYVLVQQLENNLVVPKVMERAVKLHPLAVMVALLAGAQLLGVTGAVLSVPVTAALAVVIQEVRRERREHERRRIGDAPALVEPLDEGAAQGAAPRPAVPSAVRPPSGEAAG